MDENERETSPLLEIPATQETKPRAKTFSYGSANVKEEEQLRKADKPQLKKGVVQGSSLLVQTKSHCHEDRSERNGPDVRARKTLIIASVLCLAFMVAEIVGGYIASSLAIMTDAAHLLTDFASFMISLFSLFVAARPATRRMSFGWHRAEVLGAFASVLMIWVITGVLVYIAIERIINKQFDVDGEVMLITASVGVAVNLIMGFILHRGGVGHSHGGGGGHGHSHGGGGHSHGHRRSVSNHDILNHIHGEKNNLTTVVEHSGDHHHDHHDHDHDHDHDHHHDHDHNGTKEVVIIAQTASDLEAAQEALENERHDFAPTNINVRAAFIHVIGDFLQSVGVFVAALVIYFKPHLGIIDPICTFVFSVLVLITTIAIMRDALTVLMEGIPRGVDFVEVNESLLALDGVERVHDLRIWSLTMDKTALAVHLAVDRKHDTQTVLRKARELLRQRYRIYECTVQIEHFSDDMNECERCEVPKA